MFDSMLNETNFTCGKFLICGWAGQLSTSNVNFQFSVLNFLFIFCIHFSNKLLSIQLYGRDLDLHDFTFLKHLRVLDLPMTNIGIFSPTAFALTKPVFLSLLCLPPKHFSLNSADKDLSGKHGKK